MNPRLVVSIVSFAFAGACAAPAVPDGPHEGTTSGSAPTASASSAPLPAVLPGMYPCNADSECALTTYPGCCSCCPCEELHAISVAELKRLEDDCAVVECASHCDKASVTCPKCVNPADEGMHARCTSGSCTLVER